MEQLLGRTQFISIHSLVKRETCRVPRLVRPNDYFNPLPRKEGDSISDY